MRQHFFPFIIIANFPRHFILRNTALVTKCSLLLSPCVIKIMGSINSPLRASFLKTNKSIY